MSGYLKLTKTPDMMAIALARTFSPITRHWLRNYEILEKRRFRYREKDTKTTYPSEMLVDRREIRINLDVDLPEKRELEWVYADTIAAHEIGMKGLLYPGHSQMLLELSSATPGSLGSQCRLNRLVTEIAELYEDDQVWELLSQNFAGVVADYSNMYITSEMLSTMVAQKRRLLEHTTYQNWNETTRKKAKEQIEALDEQSGKLSIYGIGAMLWRKLEKRFGERVGDLLNLITQNAFVSTRSDDLIQWKRKADALAGVRIPISTREETRYNKKGMIPVDGLMLAAINCENIEKPFKEIERNLSEVGYWKDVTVSPKTITILPDPHSLPQHAPIEIGDVWLALHSIFAVTFLTSKGGFTNVLIKKSVLDYTDKEAIRIALDLFNLRRELLQHFRVVSMDPPMPEFLISTYNYLNGSMTLKEYIYETRGCVRVTRDLDGKTLSQIVKPYDQLPKEFKKYYQSHRDKFRRWSKDPDAYFSKTIELLREK